MPSIKTILAAVAFAVSLGLFGCASETENAVDEDARNLENPYQTVYTHLRYLQEDNLRDPAVAASTLNAPDASADDKEKLAVKLKKILDGRNLYVDIDDLPKDPNYVDTTNKKFLGKHVYLLFDSEPNIYVKKYGDKWLYSRETLQAIPKLYKETFPFDVDRLLAKMPLWVNAKVLGLEIWQLIAIVLILIVGFFLLKILTWIFGYFVIKVAKRVTKSRVVDKYIHPIARPLSWLTLVVALDIAQPVFRFPITMNVVLDYVFKIMIPLLITICAFKISDLMGDILERVAEKTHTKIDDQLMPLARKGLKLIVLVGGTIYILQNIGVNITPLLAGASIGGLAIALAAKDALSNLFGSITILTDQPFEVGDWINFNGMDGTVEEVGVRSTRIRTFYNSLISVPNGVLANATIDNFGRRQYRRYFTKISITYDTPPDLIEAYVDGLREIVVNHPKTWKDYYQIHLNDFNSSSLDIMFYIFFEVPDWGKELEARHEVILETVRLAEDLGVRFAFPTQTVHVENFPEKNSLTPEYTEDKAAFMKKVKSFIEKRKSLPKPNGEN